MTMRPTEPTEDFERRGGVLMRNLGRIALAAMVATGTLVDSTSARAHDAEQIVAWNTRGEAPLAAHPVALAGKTESLLDELWVTNEKRLAYLTNEGLELTFMPLRWRPFRSVG